MFQQDKSTDIHRLYMLFSRVPDTLKGVHKCMVSCIKEAGKEIF